MGLSGILTRPRKRTSTSQGVTLGQVIALANQKGGVAKTTTTLNLAVAFQEQGFNVLGVDLDPQGNLTMSQGMDPDNVERSMFDVLVHSLLDEVIHRTEIDLAVSSIDLAGAELALSSMIGRERALQKALLPVRSRYDYILIDTAVARAPDDQRPHGLGQRHRAGAVRVPRSGASSSSRTRSR